MAGLYLICQDNQLLTVAPQIMRLVYWLSNDRVSVLSCLVRSLVTLALAKYLSHSTQKNVGNIKVFVCSIKVDGIHWSNEDSYTYAPKVQTIDTTRLL